MYKPKIEDFSTGGSMIDPYGSYDYEKYSEALDEYIKESDRLVQLTKRHKVIMDTKDIIVSVYTNASGFLWSMCKVDSGTDLGWSDHHGNCKHSGAFIKYEDALEDAINLIDECDLEQFRKNTPDGKFHWGNYADYLADNHRVKKTRKEKLKKIDKNLKI